jgi:DNA polymerase III subunit epsilon
MAMTVGQVEFTAIDFESAGTRPGGTDHPIQVGVAVMSGLNIRVDAGFVSYISSSEPVTWKARRVHGISDEDLAGAPGMHELWPRLRDLLANRWVVAHGAATEKRFLRAYPFHGFGPWVDTLKLARALDPGQASHALGELVEGYGLLDEMRDMVPGFRWHDAHSDALASLVLLRFLILTHDLVGMEASVLVNPDDSAFHRYKSSRRPR